VLEIADEALAAIKEDVAKARGRRSDTEQLRAMISMLTETVASVSVQKDSSVVGVANREPSGVRLTISLRRAPPGAKPARQEMQERG